MGCITKLSFGKKFYAHFGEGELCPLFLKINLCVVQIVKTYGYVLIFLWIFHCRL